MAITPIESQAFESPAAGPEMPYEDETREELRQQIKYATWNLEQASKFYHTAIERLLAYNAGRPLPDLPTDNSF